MPLLFPHTGRTRHAVPPAATNEERLRAVLWYARFAPSVHNSQPWRVTLSGRDAFVLRRDGKRALPAADALGRGAWMALGAFIENACAAAAAMGMIGEVETVGDGGDLAVTLRLSPGGAAPSPDPALAAMVRRATNRAPFEPLSQIPETIRALDPGALNGAYAVFIAEPRDLTAIAELIRAGTALAYRNRDFCEEHAAWLRNNWTRRRDGIPGYAIGVGTALSFMLPRIIKTKDMSVLRADMEWKKTQSSNLFVVVSADDESPRGWLAAGRVLQRLLLRATAAGVEQSPNAAPIEMGNLVTEVQRLPGVGGHPQLLVRLGRARPRQRLTPRRPLSDFVQPDHDVPPNGV